jgi:hypothetical protein
MNNERLEQLLSFLEEDPNDPFNIYCVANEYKNINPEKASQYYKDLLLNHPKYVPTYYHAAELLINNNDIEKAEKVIADGIIQALDQSDQLALRELRNLQNNLLEY